MKKIIIETSEEAQKRLDDRANEIINRRTCPECGHISQFNYQGRTRKYGGFLKLKAIIYSVYECKECYCKWIIKGDE